MVKIFVKEDLNKSVQSIETYVTSEKLMSFDNLSEISKKTETVMPEQPSPKKVNPESKCPWVKEMNAKGGYTKSEAKKEEGRCPYMINNERKVRNTDSNCPWVKEMNAKGGYTLNEAKKEETRCPYMIK